MKRSQIKAIKAKSNRLKFKFENQVVMTTRKPTPTERKSYLKLARKNIENLKPEQSLIFQNGLNVMKEKETHPSDLELENKGGRYRERTVLVHRLNGKETSYPLSKYRKTKQLYARDIL